MTRSDGKAGALTTVRETPRYHWLALVVASLLGVGATYFHWIGLVVGGALVGLVATNLKRALLAGIGFGVLVVLVWASLLSLSGVLGRAVAMGEISLVAVGIALGLSTLGSLVRGVV